MESIERMKDRIEHIQEQDFEAYQSDIFDTIALRVWKEHNGDIDAILAKESLEIESIDPQAIGFIDGSRISMGCVAHIEPGWIRKGDRYPAKLFLSAA